MAERFLDGRVILHCGDCLEVLAQLDENSVDSVVTDPPYLLTSIVNRFGADGAAPAQHGQDGRYKRLSGGFMNKRWDAPGDSHGLSVFEAWLAGFIAGEGCFRIQAHKNDRYYTCQFSIHLRQDDAPILLACQKRVGGRIVFGDARENKHGIKSAPDIRWLVETQESCLALAHILDRVPLFAKKASDYALWRRGLDLWINTPKGSRWHGARDVSEMAALHRQLQTIKRWDGTEVDLNFDPFMPPAQAFHYHWAKEVYRALKPGAHLIAMGGTRTYHRLACAIEEAGFEIRDTISWLYGSGFPKSHDVSKGIDRAAGAERTYRIDPRWADKYPNGPKGGDPSPMVRQAARSNDPLMTSDAATDAARQWEGWGTALKPACELIVLARKPLSEGTVAANVLRWGTGAINVDGCRVGDDVTTTLRNGNSGGNGAYGRDERIFTRENPPGRWPANVVHDGSDEVTAAFPENAGNNGQASDFRRSEKSVYGEYANEISSARERDNQGSAARFFYAAKPDAEPFVAKAKGRWPANLIHDGSDEVTAAFPDTDGAVSNGRKGVAGIYDDGIGSAAQAPSYGDSGSAARFFYQVKPDAEPFSGQAKGRWPANLIHDGSPEVVAAFPETDGGGSDSLDLKRHAGGGIIYGEDDGGQSKVSRKVGDGSAARFFYTSKADANDRLGSKHPTVKPLDLMQWLVRLVTPKGGTVLDPFAGTGTTGEAAFREGCNAVLIEAEPEYQADIRRRMQLVLSGPDERARQSIKAKGLPVDHGPLFGWSKEA